MLTSRHQTHMSRKLYLVVTKSSGRRALSLTIDLVKTRLELHELDEYALLRLLQVRRRSRKGQRENDGHSVLFAAACWPAL